jgi:hypothetical protein
MPWRRKTDFVGLTIIVVLLLTNGCRNRAQSGDGEVEPDGEPAQYSATLVRIVEDETRRETSISREVRSGEMRRDEWTEQGQKRALIWRPDIGRGFLLDLDGRVYVEIEITAGLSRESGGAARNQHYVSTPRNAAESDPADATVQSIDQYFDDRQPPIRSEIRVLPTVEIDGRRCAVYEQRAVFPDGHAETTRRFRARDLSGLALRVESEAEPGSSKVITDRRDVRLEVAPDAFIVPADFKKVDKLPR